MESLFWFDYETFGADPQKDRPSQFAGIRTDTDLNIVSDPLTIYCKPSPDFLPNPDACLITGITPQHALREGMPEAQFISAIREEMAQPNTCNVGYNNIRFDDEVTRNTLYRNFFDPYEHEWKNGNSRWDLIDIVRLTHALRPEGIEWPVDDKGNPSFRLELLTAANGISHEAAHDAMSDVYATIAMAKLIKEKQGKLYDYAFTHRQKNSLFPLFNLVAHKPVFHVSSKIPAALGCCALVAPICEHPMNKNGIVVFDLRQDPTILLDLSKDEIKRRLYSRAEELSESEERPLLKTIHLNKSPVVCPASMLKTMPEGRLEKWELNVTHMQNHLETLRRYPELRQKVSDIFNDRFDSSSKDPDLMIYSGGFFSANDKAQMAKVRASNSEELADTEFHFEDSRLEEMLFRYKARNYSETLSFEEQERWSLFCRDRLMSPELSFYTVEQFGNRLYELAGDSSLDENKRFILEELKYYAESIIPYD